MRWADQIPADSELRALLDTEGPLRLAWDDSILDIERPLPLLVVHRMDDDDPVTRRLLAGQTSKLILGPEQPVEETGRLVATIAEVQADRFDVFVVVEIWAAPGAEARGGGFAVGIADPEDVPEAVDALIEALAGTGRSTFATDDLAPSGRQPLIDADRARSIGCLRVGLEVPPVYSDPATGRFYPTALAELRREMNHALQRFFFEFIRVHSNLDLRDFRELGRRTIVEAGYEVDRRLAEIGGGLEPLLHMTPVNTREAWEEFRAAGFEKEPSFHYRLLPFDPDLLKRKLYDLPLETVEDPTIESLLRAKRVEIDRTITMLEDRDTPRFLPGSIQTYGAVEPSLVDDALHILDRTEPGTPSEPASIEEFAQVARDEIELYRNDAPELSSVVKMRPDMPGVMVAHGDLYLGAGGQLARSRIEPLLQHEVGTHIVTYLNGTAQPLLLLSVGLPAYEQTQEGLAMFAEYMAGGLDADRMRVIAARVIATRDVSEEATFVEVFDKLHREYAFLPGTAWSITMRATRSGGSVKDAIYLRGLLAVLEHLRSGGALEPLLVGKIALEQVPLIEELLWRGILQRPRLRPRWLEGLVAEERLSVARAGLTPLDLIGVQS